ncbi:hypothetical protein PCASD_04050 [Puccinia coronata f. sp. avenae]|uniref:Uncharacterized protein n=2 Tax=Puccinia coronata f. sp. avenae TaxID=200324 RepID=A0A2N5VCE3_9BASI|nr:hypothetical protein PCASD_04050 [Puccinia coronata f. sp. avenae]
MSMHKSVQAAVAVAMAAHNQQLAQMQTSLAQKDELISKITKKLEDLEVRSAKKKPRHSDSSALNPSAEGPKDGKPRRSKGAITAQREKETLVTNSSTPKAKKGKAKPSNEYFTPTYQKGKGKEKPCNPATSSSLAQKVSSLAKKTPVQKPPGKKQITPASATPTRKNVNQMLEFDVPETFLKTRILWGLLEENSVPSAPDPSTLQEFYERFRDAEELQSAANDIRAPKLVPKSQIVTLKDLKLGQKKVGRNILNVEEFFFLYIKATLARLGIRRWAPNLEDSLDSLYNEACRVAAIKSIQQVAGNGAYQCMNCNVKFLNKIDLLIQAYNHYVHFRQCGKYNRELKSTGHYVEEAERKAISGARKRLRNARVNFGKKNNLPSCYMKILDCLDAHSDDEYSDKHKCYLIKTVPFWSANTNKFFRRLDFLMDKDFKCDGRRDQRRKGRMPSRKLESIFTKTPTGLPIDFYDPDWFNDLLPAQKHKAANIWLVNFLPDANQSLLGKQHPDEKLCDSKLINKYWEELTKPYDLSHEIKPVEDDESSSDSEKSDDSSYCGEEVVLSDTSGEEESDDNEGEDDVDIH